MNTILKLEHIQIYYGNEGNIPKPLKTLAFLWKLGNFSELWVRPVLERQRCSTVFLRLIP